MADNEINVNALPVKTAPSTGDKMLMIGAAEEYQIDYDKLASAILDKLATKQYSELDTTAKTVLGALDELNGKIAVSVPDLEDGEDIREYIYENYKNGITFKVVSISSSLSLDNGLPSTAGGFALFFSPQTAGYGEIVFFTYENKVYLCKLGGGTWGEWVPI